MNRIIQFSAIALGIVILVMGCTTPAQDTNTNLSSDEIVAWVNDRPISKKAMDDTIAQMPPYMQQQFASPQGKKNLVERLVNVELIHQKAVANGFASRPEVQQKIKEVTKQVIYAEFLQEAMKNEQQPDEAAARAFYDENLKLFAAKGGEGDAQPKPFEEVKGQIIQFLGQQGQQQAFDRIIQENKTGASIRFNDQVLGLTKVDMPPAQPAPPAQPPAQPPAPPASPEKTE